MFIGPKKKPIPTKFRRNNARGEGQSTKMRGNDDDDLRSPQDVCCHQNYHEAKFFPHVIMEVLVFHVLLLGFLLMMAMTK